MPLHDVFAQLRHDRKLDIHLDKRALDDIGLDTNDPITFSAAETPLRHLLGLMLDQLDLTWTIRHGVLLITTPEEEAANLVTKVYDVHDLLVQPPDPEYRGGLPTVVPRRWPGGGYFGPGSYGTGGSVPSGAGGMGGASGTGGGMFSVDGRNPPAAPAGPVPASVAIGDPSGRALLAQTGWITGPPDPRSASLENIRAAAIEELSYFS